MVPAGPDSTAVDDMEMLRTPGADGPSTINDVADHTLYSVTERLAMIVYAPSGTLRKVKEPSAAVRAVADSVP